MIIDDGDSGYSTSGASWSYTDGISGCYNDDYYWRSTVSTPQATAEWQPDLAEGYYEVYVMYREGANRAIDAPYTVYHSGGSTTVDIDQTTSGGTWVFLGVYYFNSGTSGYVELADGPAELSKVVVADAVKWVPGTGTPSEVIIDDGDTGYSMIDTWSYGTTNSNQAYNGDYYFASTTSTETKSASWTPTLSGAGNYKVYVMYRSGSNRAQDAPYTVYYSGGSDTVTVDQKFNGGTWNLLGTYYFDAGTNGYVFMGDYTGEDPWRLIAADRMMFVFTGE